MAPSSNQVLLSPAELSYLHASLSLHPPIRPDARSPTQFRPLIAETDILPGTNGSARVCFADGTEAIVGVKAEVEKSATKPGARLVSSTSLTAADDEGDNENPESGRTGRMGENTWVEVTVEIPGFRDDDAMPVFLSALLSEALLADGEFSRKLWINSRFHWRLYVDILLLSPPLSYPLPLLSLTTHLALLSTRIPKLKSELEEDPLFNDDWDAAVFLYPGDKKSKGHARPPVTLLVMAVADNIIFDPSKEELAVADVVLAVSVGERSTRSSHTDVEAMEIDSKPPRNLRLLSIRTIDPPSRLTPLGVPNFLNTATGGSAAGSMQQLENAEAEGVWQPPRGGAKRKIIAAMIHQILEEGGVGQEILDGLDAVDLG